MDVRPVVAQGDGWMIVLDEDGELCTITSQPEDNSIESLLCTQTRRSASPAEQVSVMLRSVSLIAAGFVLIACVTIPSIAMINTSKLAGTHQK